MVWRVIEAVGYVGNYRMVCLFDLNLLFELRILDFGVILLYISWVRFVRKFRMIFFYIMIIKWIFELT